MISRGNIIHLPVLLSMWRINPGIEASRVLTLLTQLERHAERSATEPKHLASVLNPLLLLRQHARCFDFAYSSAQHDDYCGNVSILDELQNCKVT